MIDFKKLRDIREDNDLNQRKMAKILHVKRSTYSLWELGINIIPLEKLCEFADYFNYSIDYVLGLSRKRNTKRISHGIDFLVLGKKIKKIRIQNNLSQEDLGNILGVTQACIAKYEKGIIQISTSNLYKISKKFNISLDELCNKEEITITSNL